MAEMKAEQLQVKLTPAAAAYVRAKGGQIMLIEGYRSGCCGGSARLPVVHLGEPRNREAFRMLEMDGCIVWFSAGLQENYTVELAVLWFLKKLSVSEDPVSG